MSIVMSREEVIAFTGMCYTSIYNKMCDGTFPSSRTTGGKGRKALWIRSEVEEWLLNLPVKELIDRTLAP